jgi:RNA polymerase sigma factor (sigma-70 family)
MIKEQNDVKLAELVRENSDSSALNELIDRHSGICYKIYNKYFYKNFSLYAQDLQMEKDSLIYQAAKTYNPDFGTKFSTWLGNVVTYACLNACNNNNKEIAMDSDILNQFVDSNLEQQMSFLNKNKDMISQIEDAIDSSCDKTAKEVIKMRYLSNGNKVKTFKEIADHFGVSTQTVVNWHDKFISFLRKKLKSESNLDIV